MGPMSTSPTLSPREYEVVGLVARGLRNREIADHLSIAEKTVKNHVYNIFSTIGVRSRVEAANWYHKRQESGPRATTHGA